MIVNNYSLNHAPFGTHKIISNMLNKGETILDIGCNDGYLIKFHPSGVFTGIDYSSKSAAKAKRSGFKKVMVGDLNNYAKFKLKDKFHTLIFADILEHLLYPQKVLSYFVSKNLNSKPNI